MQNVDDLFGKTGYKNGSTIRVRIPPRYTSALGAAINVNNSVETETSITVVQRNIGLAYSSIDLTLSIDMFSDRFIKPAMAQLASDIDKDGYAVFAGAVGLTTPGVYVAGRPTAWTGADVGTLRPFLDAGARLTDAAAPIDDQRYVAVTPSTNAAVVDGLKGLFQSSTEIAEQYKRGLMGLAAGFEWVQSQSLSSFTSGTRTVGATTVTGDQTGSSLIIALAGALTVTAGDQFTIGTAGTADAVYSINPLTRQPTNKLQVFTVTAATAFVAGAATLTISPTIDNTAPDQTVSLNAKNGAAVNFMGAASTTTDMNVAWHKEAMLVAFCDLSSDLPGAEATVARDPESKIAVRMVRQYAAESDLLAVRLDVLYGFKLVRPQLAVRIQG
jgi:hypothetical protein